MLHYIYIAPRSMLGRFCRAAAEEFFLIYNVHHLRSSQNFHVQPAGKFRAGCFVRDGKKAV